MRFRHFPSLTLSGARGRVPRGMAAVLLGLQFLLWGGGSTLEAKAAAESLARYAHVEEEGAKCPPVHSHLDCLICRTFASGALAVKPRDLLPTAIHHDGLAVAAIVRITGEDSRGPLGSRAPPASVTPDRTIA